MTLPARQAHAQETLQTGPHGALLPIGEQGFIR
jgi:hypothetical protein